MRELALHILDIVENSISAGADRIRVAVNENLEEDTLTILIEDNGCGMDAATLAKVTDPFVTSRTTRRVGLGIPFFKAAAEACNGFLNIQSQPGKGTQVEVCFQHSHIDRMPLGDLASTFITLIIGAPDIHWVFEYQINDKRFVFDSEPIKKIFEDVSFSEPAVMKCIREMIQEGIEDLHKESTAEKEPL